MHLLILTSNPNSDDPESLFYGEIRKKKYSSVRSPHGFVSGINEDPKVKKLRFSEKFTLICIFQRHMISLVCGIYYMFLLLLFSCLVYSSTKTQKSWVDQLDTNSTDYVNQLYCGTAARGVTYLTDDKKAVDSEGFEEGLAKIIQVYKSDSNHTPILNAIEVKWLRSQFVAIWKDRGIKEAWKNREAFYKVYKVLFFMKKNSNREISFASLLTDAKDKRALVHAISQSLSFLDHVKQGSTDTLCLALVADLEHSLRSQEFTTTKIDSKTDIQTVSTERADSFHPKAHEEIKPHSSKDSKNAQKNVVAKAIGYFAEGMETRSQVEKDIIADIIQAFNIFPEDMEDREITLLSIYLYSHIRTYLNSKSIADHTRVKLAAELLSKFMRRIVQRGHPRNSQARAMMGAIFKKLDIDIDDFMHFTDHEKKKINSLDGGATFNSIDDTYWVLEIIGTDLFNETLAHPKIINLLAILDEYKLQLEYLCPSIHLITEKLRLIFWKNL
jgi:hypothetical protein